MVDPTDVTIYNRTDDELEEFLLFCVLVAGKRALTICAALDGILKYGKSIYGDVSPFSVIRGLIEDECLQEILFQFGIGCHTRKAQYLKNLMEANLDIRTCSVDDLETVNGIGSKTSRYFILHSRPVNDIACLDRHILSALKDWGYKVPDSTPSKKEYKRIEILFLQEASKRNKTVAELDLEIWNARHR